MSGCAQCGMHVENPADFHPFAACLMFKGCHNSTQVDANLSFVVDYGRTLERASRDAEIAELKQLRAHRDPFLRCNCGAHEEDGELVFSICVDCYDNRDVKAEIASLRGLLVEALTRMMLCETGKTFEEMDAEQAEIDEVKARIAAALEEKP